MRLMLAAVVALAVAPSLARAQAVLPCPVRVGSGCNAVVPFGGTLAVTPGPAAGNSTYERVINVGPSTAGIAWCSRFGTPVVNGGGSFPLAPFGNTLSMPSVEEYIGAAGVVPPQAQLLCTSDGGTSGTSAAVLTVETR